MKDLFISQIEEHSSDNDGYLPRSRQNSRQNSTNSVGSASGSNNIIWESQAAKILKRSGLRESRDAGDSGSRSSFSDMMVDHHLVHRFREQNHQHREELAKKQELMFTPEQLEDIRMEEQFTQAVKSRRARIMELAAMPATSAVAGGMPTGRGSSFENNYRFDGNVNPLGRVSDINGNPLSHSMHNLGSLSSNRRAITTGRRSQIDMYNNGGEPASAQSRGGGVRDSSITGSILSMLHLDFLLGTKPDPHRTGSLSMRHSRHSISAVHNRRRSDDVPKDLGDSDEESLIGNFELEEDDDNAKENARLAEVEKRRIAIAQGRFNKRKVKPGVLAQNFRADSLSKSIDETTNPLQRLSGYRN